MDIDKEDKEEEYERTSYTGATQDMDDLWIDTNVFRINKGKGKASEVELEEKEEIIPDNEYEQQEEHEEYKEHEEQKIKKHKRVTNQEFK